MSRYLFNGAVVAALWLGMQPDLWAQTPRRDADTAADPVSARLASLEESLRFMQETLTKNVDDLMLFRRMEDLADVDKIRYVGPPSRHNKNPTAQGAGNPLVLFAYTFLPKNRQPATKLPLLVFVH